MKKRHRDLLRRVEAINMRRDIQEQRNAWESGRELRDTLGEYQVRGLLERVHAAELAAGEAVEARRWLAHLHRNEMAGLEGEEPIIKFREEP
jgi:hypothetical protein